MRLFPREGDIPSSPAAKAGRRKEGTLSRLPSSDLRERSTDRHRIPRWPDSPARWSGSTNHNRASRPGNEERLNTYARFGAVLDERKRGQSDAKREGRDVGARRAASGPAVREAPRSAASANTRRWERGREGKKKEREEYISV